MADYATTEDLETVWRVLTDSETAMAAELISLASAEIRQRARATGRDFDKMIDEYPDLSVIAKSVVCDAVRRYMNGVADDSPAMTQMTQSALGYSLTGTYLSPGGSFLIRDNELKRLGLRRQGIRVVSMA